MGQQSLLIAMAASMLFLGGLNGCAKPAENAAVEPAAKASAQTSFATPDEAVAALVAAGEKVDTAGLQAMLGPDTTGLLSSGDPVQDRKERDGFLKRYAAYHELVAGDPDNLVLMVGEDRWPLPIPLVRRSGRWYWDGAAGASELIVRRIGANELRTIDVMHGFVAAEQDYAASAHDGAPRGLYTLKVRSSPGKHDGLYWESPPGKPPSPAGPGLAGANAEGYAITGTLANPYHGYLFRLLTSQGPDAEGGARDYLVDGRLTKGFALLAYPSAYGASGVMTFMVNQDGVVWQRDLGADTAQAAAAIQQFNPDNNWTPLAPEG
jgi:Protein of unknown function (DUF2950)